MLRVACHDSLTPQPNILFIVHDGVGIDRLQDFNPSPLAVTRQ
jgi:hypothetical protein